MVLIPIVARAALFGALLLCVVMVVLMTTPWLRRPPAATPNKGAAGTEPKETNWQCNLKRDGQKKGNVTITWGHTAGDAAWACDNWVSDCGNEGGCDAAPLS
jgi:hypothetical protein